MASKLDLRTCRWNLEFHKTIVNQGEQSVDVYFLYWGDGEGVSLGVPQGRDDVAQFIFATIVAGQKTLKALPKGLTIDEFGPHRAKQETFKKVVRKHRGLP